MSFLKRWDEALDKAFAPKVDKLKVLEEKLTNTFSVYKLEIQSDISTMNTALGSTKQDINAFKTKAVNDIDKLKDLTTRIEKLEVYSGMKRVIDPAKPAVEKTAFQM